MNDYSDEQIVSEFYSSSEDVSWGKPTKRELLKYFERKSTPAFSRRQTFPFSKMNSSGLLKEWRILQSSKNSSCSNLEMTTNEVQNDSLISLSSDSSDEKDELKDMPEILSTCNNTKQSELSPSVIVLSSEEDEIDYEIDDTLNRFKKFTVNSDENSNTDDVSSKRFIVKQERNDHNGTMGTSKYLSASQLSSSPDFSDNSNKNTFTTSTSSKTQYFSANEENDNASAKTSLRNTLEDSFHAPNQSINNTSMEYNEYDESLDDTFDDMDKMLNNHLETASDDESKITPYKNEIHRKIERSTKIETKIPMLLLNSKKVIPKQEDFKIPTHLPLRKTPCKKESFKFKDTVSPVRMYIKNSTVPLLKQTHKPCTVQSKLFPSDGTRSILPEIVHKNILESLPEVVYKPSKLVVEKSASKIILPDNIKKLLKERIVIKHEVPRRLLSKKDDFCASDMLRRDDLSYIVCDDKNVSLHSSKQGYNL